ncbi:MAG: hypothetical protein MZV70_71855 [Desulfobacterales bacterium]|nr:hypothetical protein [Desulfobacterales bacterium]
MMLAVAVACLPDLLHGPPHRALGRLALLRLLRGLHAYLIDASPASGTTPCRRSAG